MSIHPDRSTTRLNKRRATIPNFIFALVVMVMAVLGGLLVSVPVMAETVLVDPNLPKCEISQTSSDDQPCVCPEGRAISTGCLAPINVSKIPVCGDGQKSTIQTPCTCQTGATDTSACISCNKVDCSGLIVAYVNPAIKLLSGLVGIVVTISIVAAGIQYSTSKDETSKVTAARERIEKAVAALLAYLLLLALLNWIVPGGIA